MTVGLATSPGQRARIDLELTERIEIAVGLGLKFGLKVFSDNKVGIEVVIEARGIDTLGIPDQSDEGDAIAGTARRQIDVIGVHQAGGCLEVVAVMRIPGLVEKQALDRDRPGGLRSHGQRHQSQQKCETQTPPESAGPG